jgi:acyl-CoA thioesterase-1
MKKPDPLTYLEDICIELDKKWPDNRTVNIVCHGHSVPSGYFATPFVDTFNAYPHLLHKIIKERFPYAVVNVIVTAIGGENSQEGCQRFEEDVLCHKPDVLTIDYSLNDRLIGLDQARTNWSQMIERALEKEIKIILMTPSWEQSYYARNSEQKASWKELEKQTKQVRNLAEKYGVGLCDTFEVFSRYCEHKESLIDLLSHVNHPNRKGHELIANELGRWFLAR